ncbi:Uncharacterised protein [Chlamydia trachomatis]|nr:Uncharacterised protein [Chlamydia trachomatis]
MMNRMMANTFMLEKTNSDSPNAFADKAFSEKMRKAKIAHHIQTGDSGNHLCISWPAARNSKATVTAQPNQ